MLLRSFLAGNEGLHKELVRLIGSRRLKIPDGIQIASAIFAETGLFITAGKKLCAAARKEKLNALFL